MRQFIPAGLGRHSRAWNDIRKLHSYQFVNQYERPANEAAEVSAAMAIATPLYALPIASAPALVPAVATSSPVVVIPPPAVPSATLGEITVDPALIAALAPIVESLAAGLFRALITQLSATTAPASGAVATAAPTPAPALDLGALVTTLVPLLTSQLSTALPSLIAAEVAKIVPAPAAKS